MNKHFAVNALSYNIAFNKNERVEKKINKNVWCASEYLTSRFLIIISQLVLDAICMLLVFREI